MSATPRTDAESVQVNGMARAYLCEETWREAVNADFARQLETELAETRAKLVEAAVAAGKERDRSERVLALLKAHGVEVVE